MDARKGFCNVNLILRKIGGQDPNFEHAIFLKHSLILIGQS